MCGPLLALTGLMNLTGHREDYKTPALAVDDNLQLIQASLMIHT